MTTEHGSTLEITSHDNARAAPRWSSRLHPVQNEPTAVAAEHDTAHPPGQSKAQSPGWTLDQLSGRLSEISAPGGGARLTLAFELVLQAQLGGEPAAWITTMASTFFPPDAARSGVDLDALPVVRVPDGRTAARVADKLLRSGAFALVVVDLDTWRFIPTPLQSRLLGLAVRHEAAVLFLTEKKSEDPSLGSLVSLRAEATRRRTAEDRFACEARILKDKRRGPGWSHHELRHGPAGLH